MRILYLTQWFDPEPGVIKGTAFVARLIESGHQVIVVTGLPNYPTGKIYPGYRFRAFQVEERDGLIIHRLPLYPSHNSSSIGRAVNFLSFFFSALLYGLLRGGRFDLAYVYHPPITVGLAAALFGYVHRLKFILEIQDLWPDTVVASGMSGTTKMHQMLTTCCNFVYKRASMIIVQSNAMKTILVGRHVPCEKLAVIYNWADSSALSAKEPYSRSLLADRKRFTFLYAGNLGRAQALESVIMAAHRASQSGAVLDLVLIGDGIDAGRLKSLASSINADNVRFLPRVSIEEIRTYIEDTDVLMMHLSNESHFSATIPSKTQYYLAVGKPIIAGVSGEAADLLRRSGAAIVVPPQDVELLAKAMTMLSNESLDKLIEFGKNGKQFYINNMSFESGMSQTLRIIDKAANFMK